MKSFFIWIGEIIKSIIEHKTISNNKWLIMWFLVGGGAGGAAGIQQLRVDAMEAAGVKAVTATAAAFQEIKNSTLPVKKAKAIVSVCQTDCTLKKVKQLIEKNDKAHLSRWH